MAQLQEKLNGSNDGVGANRPGVAGTIPVPMGTALSNQRYWNLLGVRLKRMAQESSREELSEVSELMVRSA